MTASKLVGRGWIALVLLALYVPLGAMVIMSFNASRFGTLPLDFSVEWYRSLGPDNPLIESTLVSVELATYVSITCAVIGTGLALWLRSGVSKLGTSAANGALMATVTVPVLILSVGMLAVLQELGLGQSGLSLWLGCSVVSLPYMVFVVLARLQSLDPDLVRASRSLGAGPIKTFVRVTLPLMSSAVLAGALMAFVICFNNFTVQLFLAPVGVQTLPVNIYGQTRVGITPDINAVSTLIVVVTVVGVVTLQILSKGTARLISAPTERNTHDG